MLSLLDESTLQVLLGLSPKKLWVTMAYILCQCCMTVTQFTVVDICLQWQLRRQTFQFDQSATIIFCLTASETMLPLPALAWLQTTSGTWQSLTTLTWTSASTKCRRTAFHRVGRSTTSHSGWGWTLLILRRWLTDVYYRWWRASLVSSAVSVMMYSYLQQPAQHGNVYSYVWLILLLLAFFF